MIDTVTMITMGIRGFNWFITLSCALIILSITEKTQAHNNTEQLNLLTNERSSHIVTAFDSIIDHFSENKTTTEILDIVTNLNYEIAQFIDTNKNEILGNTCYTNNRSMPIAKFQSFLRIVDNLYENDFKDCQKSAKLQSSECLNFATSIIIAYYLPGNNWKTFINDMLYSNNATALKLDLFESVVNHFTLMVSHQKFNRLTFIYSKLN